MAIEAENGVRRRRRRWMKVAWAAVAALVMFPLALLLATSATGESQAEVPTYRAG